MLVPHVTATDHGASLRTYQAKSADGLFISDVLVDGLARKLIAAGQFAATVEPPHGDPALALTLEESRLLQHGLQAALRSRQR